jgi:DNA-binding transcriptional ArsR family regulator
MAPRPAKAKARGEAGKRSAKRPAMTEKRGPAPEVRKASLAFLLSHPVRVQILAAAHREAISPSEFARAHGLETSSVAEHFRRLATYGAIKLIRKEPVRGSVRHLYVGTKRGVITAKDWQTLPESVQSDIAAAGLQDFLVVTAHAIDTGSFAARGDFVFTWDEVELDELGWDKLAKMLRLLWTKMPGLEEEAAMRRAKTGERGMKAIVGLAAFEAPKATRPVRKKSA